jgi:intracellular multiplication protein IcmP
MLRWPALVLLVILAALCLTRAPLERHRKRFGLEGMQKALAEIHPLGAAWLGKGLKLVRPSPPEMPLAPLDPALNLEEWKTRYIRGNSPEETHDTMLRSLKAQLGNRWTGPAAATAAEKCLFVAFSLFIQRKKDQAQGILEELSLELKGSLKNGPPTSTKHVSSRFLRNLDQQLSRGDFNVAIQMANKHAFSRPALLTLLQEARLRAGVVNPGLFAAIQFLDRDLWLVMSAASYPRDGLPPYVMAITSCPEAAAALAHWKAECLAGCPLTTPQISSLIKIFGRS